MACACIWVFSRSSLKSEYVDRWYEMDVSLIMLCAIIWLAGIGLFCLWSFYGIDWVCEKTNIDSDILEIITDYALTFWMVFPPCVLIGYLLP